MFILYHLFNTQALQEMCATQKKRKKETLVLLTSNPKMNTSLQTERLGVSICTAYCVLKHLKYKRIIHQEDGHWPKTLVNELYQPALKHPYFTPFLNSITLTSIAC